MRCSPVSLMARVSVLWLCCSVLPRSYSVFHSPGMFRDRPSRLQACHPWQHCLPHNRRCKAGASILPGEHHCHPLRIPWKRYLTDELLCMSVPGIQQGNGTSTGEEVEKSGMVVMVGRKVSIIRHLGSHQSMEKSKERNSIASAHEVCDLLLRKHVMKYGETSVSQFL